MAIELVTGKAGVPHVDSEDVGAFNAYSLGSGAYIMQGCGVTAKSANSVSIAAGEILWEGRHIRVKGSGESLAIANGQTGYNRRDLITLNYSKDSSGIESVSFAVVKGIATTGTATDPSVKVGSILAGDTSAVIPFARITLSGISVATPTVLLGSLPSLVSLRDSVYPNIIWQGSTSEPLTLEIPKLKARRFIYVKTDRANDFIQIPTFDMTKTEYSTVSTLAVNDVFRIIEIHVFAAVEGDKITLSDGGYTFYDSRGLGQYLMLSAGYFANLTDVYC